MSQLTAPTISIRAATPADGRMLTRLAALDSAPIPLGPVLIAEVDGTARAALALRDGSVIADPFVPTTELVDLLRVHARAINETEERREARQPVSRLRLAA